MKYSHICATFLVSIVALQTASAHDTWLLPKAFRLQPEKPSGLSLTSGMAFPRNLFPIKQERISQAFILLAGEKTALLKRQPAPMALELPIMPPNVGVAQVFVSLQPKMLDLKPKLVREYLEEIGASDSLRAVWKNVREGDKTKRWRENYAKHAKTFVFVGEERFYRPDSSWKQPCGMALEIVPEAHPGLISAKVDFPVQVLINGKPLANFPIGCVREGSKHGTLQKTDAEGRLRLKFPQAGRYLLRGTLLQPSQTPELDWQSNFTTLTLEVRR